MNHKDKVAFFTSYISVMENNVNEKSKMLLFRELLKPLIYKGFQHNFIKNSIFLNVDRDKFFFKIFCVLDTKNTPIN